LTTFPGSKILEGTVFSVTVSRSCPTTKVFQEVLFLFTHFRLWASIIVSQAQVVHIDLTLREYNVFSLW